MTDYYDAHEISGFTGGGGQDDQEYKFVVVFERKVIRSAKDIKGLPHLRYSEARKLRDDAFRKNRKIGRIIDIDTLLSVA